jgi:hypothetical protein
VHLNFSDTDKDNAWSIANEWKERPDGLTLELLYEYNPGLEENKNNLANGQKIYTSAPIKKDELTFTDPPVTTSSQNQNETEDANNCEVETEPETHFWYDFWRDGPIVATYNYADWDTRPIYEYENSLQGEAGFYGNGGQLALNTVFFIISAGQYSAGFAAMSTGTKVIQGAGLILAADNLTMGADGYTYLGKLTFSVAGEGGVQVLNFTKIVFSVASVNSAAHSFVGTLANGKQVYVYWDASLLVWKSLELGTGMYQEINKDE